MSNIHEPYELRQIDLSVLQAKPIFDEHTRFYHALIQNEKFKGKLITPFTRTLPELKILLKYRLFNYYLKTKQVRYCSCGNLIFDTRPYIDLCKECTAKEKV